MNEFRLHFIRYTNALNPTSTESPSLRFPSLVVGQNASTPQAVLQDRTQIADDYSISVAGWGGRHEFKVGVDLNWLKGNLLFDLFKAGAFFFSADDPTLGEQVPADFALLGFGTTELNGFKYQQHGFYVQDDWHPRENLTINLGLRYDVEVGLLKHDFLNPLRGEGIPFFEGELKNDTNNFAPRLGFAWDPRNDNVTVIRGGYGHYYDVTASEIATVPIVFDGFRYAIVFIPSPSTTDVDFLRSQIDPATIEPSGFVTPPGQVEPYSKQFNIGVSRQFAGETAVNVDYVHIRSLHEWVSRELNPLNPDGTRKFAGIGSFGSFETIGDSTYNGLQLSVEKHLGRSSQVLLSYTFSKHENIADDIFSPAFAPQDQSSFAGEEGPSRQDQRHRFVLSGIVRLPYLMQLSGIFTAASARPFNVITGNDDNGDGVIRDRPPGVGRNSERGSDFVNLDLRVSKEINNWDPFRIQLLVDFFNLTNHDNFDPESFNGNLASGPNFGQPSVAFNPRQIQLGARLQW